MRTSCCLLRSMDPAGARLMLLTMLHLQDPDGSLRYAHTGFGRATSAGVHAAPDRPADFAAVGSDRVRLQAPVNIFGAGRATAVARVPIRVVGGGSRPRSPGCNPRNRIGLGPHGLIRVGSGDWNDPISAMAGNRRRFRAAGESVYNSAFAVHVLPRAAGCWRRWTRVLRGEMVRWADELRAAVAAAWVLGPCGRGMAPAVRSGGTGCSWTPTPGAWWRGWAPTSSGRPWSQRSRNGWTTRARSVRSAWGRAYGRAGRDPGAGAGYSTRCLARAHLAADAGVRPAQTLG